MTFILKLDLDMVKMCHHTKNGVYMSRHSKVIRAVIMNFPKSKCAGNVNQLIKKKNLKDKELFSPRIKFLSRYNRC